MEGAIVRQAGLEVKANVLPFATHITAQTQAFATSSAAFLTAKKALQAFLAL